MTRNPGVRTIVFALALAIPWGSGLQTAHAHDAGVEIAPPGSRPLGKTYGEWAAMWWQWAFSIPADHNPQLDPTGADCAVGQSGNVFYLAGIFGAGAGNRSCEIPANMALFFPIYNWVWMVWKTDVNPDTGLPFTMPWIRDWLVSAVEQPVTLTLVIDGVAVQDPLSYREYSPIFPTTLPPNNVIGVTEAQCDINHQGLFECATTLDGGYYFFVEPLSAGDHTLHFTAHDEWGNSQDMTYRLHVKGPMHGGNKGE